MLQAILDGQDELYEVVVVVSDRSGIPALERAARAGVESVVVPFKDRAREDASEELARALRDRDVELAVSAGFMKILDPVYFEVIGVPAMNSHPAARTGPTGQRVAAHATASRPSA